MKDYLSLRERNTWLSSMVLVMYNENLLEVWSKNLTKEENKKLKTAITMTKNALKSISDRMPINERNRIVKHSKDFEIRILSNSAAKTLQDRADKDNRTVEIERVEFEKFTNELMILKCSNCKKKCDECNTYEFFVSNLIPRFEVEKNCPYAFNTKVEKTKKSRKEKKTKNRFDDPGEDYEYNFEPKGVR